MKKDLVEIMCVIDRSGSMSSIASDAIGGFNTFLEEQKKAPGQALLSLVLFNTNTNVVHESKPLAEVPLLDTQTFRPNGSTALYDALGESIDSLGKRLSNMAEDQRPEKVIFVILTDGEENASRKFTKTQVADKISHQTDAYKWDFIYLGANQDAMSVGRSLAILDSASWTSDSKGTRSVYTTASAAVLRRRVDSSSRGISTNSSTDSTNSN